MATFWHGDFLAQGLFGKRIFWHRNILAHWHLGTVAQVPKCLCQNDHIALQGAKISMCWNVQVPKYPRGEMFWCWKVHLPERSQCQTVHVLKCSRDEASVQKWLFPKCSRRKWCIGETRRVTKQDALVLATLRYLTLYAYEFGVQSSWNWQQTLHFNFKSIMIACLALKYLMHIHLKQTHFLPLH